MERGKNISAKRDVLSSTAEAAQLDLEIHTSKQLLEKMEAQLATIGQSLAERFERGERVSDEEYNEAFALRDRVGDLEAHIGELEHQRMHIHPPIIWQ